LNKFKKIFNNLSLIQLYWVRGGLGGVFEFVPLIRTPPNPPQGGNSTETSHYFINIPIFILNSTALGVALGWYALSGLKNALRDVEKNNHPRRVLS